MNAGHKVRTPPLRPAKKGTPEKHERQRTETRRERPEFDAVRNDLQPVDDLWSDEHHLIVERIAKMKSKPFKRIGVDATPETVDRAVTVFNAVLRTFTANGIAVRVDDANLEYPGQHASGVRRPDPKCVIATILGVDVPIGIRELVDTVWTETPSRWSPDRVYRDYSYVRNGQLCLFAGFLGTDTYFPRSFRRNWADGEKQRVEDVVESFCRGVITVAQEVRIRDDCIRPTDPVFERRPLMA